MRTPLTATVPLEQLPRASRVLPLAKSIADGARVHQTSPVKIYLYNLRLDT
jgi:hypothetical protein